MQVAQSQRLVTTQELTRLATEDEIIVVRNTQAGITVFEDDKLGISVTWEGTGDPNGGDLRELPASALKNPHFRSNIMRRIFVLEEAPDTVAAAWEAVQQEWAGRQNQMADSKAAIQRLADRRIATGKSCVMPKGRDLCGNIALDKSNRPPLCAEHEQYANQYVQVEGPEGTPVWRRTVH